MAKQLNGIFEKLKSTIFNFTELSPSLEEIENANEILCEQSSIVIEVRTLSKIIVKQHPNLRQFVLRKCPNLRKVHPREVLKNPVVLVTRKVCN